MVLVTLKSVKIVGMYQRCKKQKLPSDKVYRITHEKDNWYDKNAIAVKTSTHIVVAYLNRECAVTVASLFRRNIITDTCYLITQDEVEYDCRGPNQHCCLKFKVDEKDIKDLKRVIKFSKFEMVVSE